MYLVLVHFIIIIYFTSRISDKKSCSGKQCIVFNFQNKYLIIWFVMIRIHNDKMYRYLYERQVVDVHARVAAVLRPGAQLPPV